MEEVCRGECTRVSGVVIGFCCNDEVVWDKKKFGYFQRWVIIG